MACCLALAAAFWVSSAAIRRSTSATFDEGIYLELAAGVRRDGGLAGLIGHGVAPLPILLAYVGPGEGADEGSAAERFPRAIARARTVYAALVGLPLVLVVYAWIAGRRGPLAGLVAGALVALSPTVAAHASLATTDACFALASLLALAALAAYRDRPSARMGWLVALALGSALASKYSAAFLGPVAAAAVLPRARERARAAPRGRRLRALATGLLAPLAGWGLGALAVAWAFHLFAVLPLLSPDAAPVDYERVFGSGPLAERALELGRRLLVPAPVKGMLRQSVHMMHGQPAFLDGEVSLRGWWSYYPRVLLMKSTPAELVLAAVAALALLARVVRRDDRDASASVWSWSIAILALAAVSSSLDTGVRYVLLLYPLVVLASIDALAARMAERRPRAFAAVAALLVAAQLFTAWSITPHQLAYVNAFAGGPARAYRRLVDSNLDWGQDLPALREVAERRGVGELRLAYFGTAPPEAYGVTSLPWTAEGEPRDGSWLAVSATHLQGLYLGTGDPFASLRALEPDDRAGYSIILYDLARPEVRRAYDAARAAQAGKESARSARTHSTG